MEQDIEYNDNESEKQQENEISSNEHVSNDSDKGESFLDRMEHEKRKHTQSIEIMHQRRPTREQLMEAGIIKPIKPGGFELDLVIEDVLDDIKKHEEKKKKKKMKKFAIINDDHGTAWDKYDETGKLIEFETNKVTTNSNKEYMIMDKEEIVNKKKKSKTKTKTKTKSKTKRKPKTETKTEDKANNNSPIQLTTNNLQKHNKLYSINGEILINRFIEENGDENKVSKSNNKAIKKQQSKTKINKKQQNKTTLKREESKKNKLIKTKTPKLSKKKSTKNGLQSNDMNMISNDKINKDLKQWMVKNSVWDKELYSYLILNHVLSLENLSVLNQNKFDRIIRQFRVEQFAKIRDKHSRKHIDKILIKLEKSWRKTKKKKKKKKKTEK